MDQFSLFEEGQITDETIADEAWNSTPESALKELPWYSKIKIRFDSKESFEEFADVVSKSMPYQLNLFPLVDITARAEEKMHPEWGGMPEFIQEKKLPHMMIEMTFETKEELQRFAELINQNLTAKTKSIWFPKLTRGIHFYLRYQDEA